MATLLTGCSAKSSSPVLNGPPPGPLPSTDVVTYHYDNQRSGENLKETTLATSNVNSATFGKVGEFAVDGQIDPLLEQRVFELLDKDALASDFTEACLLEFVAGRFDGDEFGFGARQAVQRLRNAARLPQR